MEKLGRRFKEKLIAYFKKKYGTPLPPSIIEQIRAGDNFQEAKKQWQLIRQFIPIKKNWRLLDAGCGFGHFVAYCLKQGYNCQGYEIEKELVEVAKEFLKIKGQDPRRIALVKNYSTPYQSQRFDFINLYYVLDYVADIPHLLRELKRILKKNSCIFIVCPNYLCFYSPTYALFFLPFLPKKINRVYFRLRGIKETKFLENLTLTTPWSLEKLFRQEGLVFQSLGQNHWEETITEERFYKRTPLLQFLIKISKLLKLTKLITLSSRLGFYTPLVYVLRKR